ncbi:hypothetical protein N9H39_09455 [Gammaproteobacteria bacterium]|nr:hypothetical protein [Gammaproteobacteria bacterium]
MDVIPAAVQQIGPELAKAEEMLQCSERLFTANFGHSSFRNHLRSNVSYSSPLSHTAGRLISFDAAPSFCYI